MFCWRFSSFDLRQICWCLGLLTCDLTQNCNWLAVSSVVIGPVILCWCLALQFLVNRATQEQIWIAFHRSYLRITRSRSSSVFTVTPRTSLVILALACDSLVGMVTISAGKLSWKGNHVGPCHHRSEQLLICLPRVPRSAGFSLVPTCFHWMYLFSWIFLSRLRTNCL